MIAAQDVESGDASGTIAPCVVIPTFNNERTLEAVVRGAALHGLEVFVVNDGSTDQTAEILARIEGIEVVTHEANRGKGAALKTGFEYAHTRGYSHAITLDSDGQHNSEEIPLFVAALQREPETLFLGTRDLVAAGAGWGSRFGNFMSSFWIWVETGARLADTQTGYRVYPLASVLALDLRGDGFGFEVEVLVKSAWSGTHLGSVHIVVRYFEGEERVSHMRPVVDFMRIAWLNVHYTSARICLPPQFLRTLCQKEFQSTTFREKLRASFVELLVNEPGSHARIAASVALGMFIGLTPLWGFQIALTLLLAHLLNASKTVAVLASNISFPVLIPGIMYGSLVLGRFLLGDDQQVNTALELTPSDLPAWVVGSFVLATIVGALGGGLTFLFLSLFGSKRARNALH